MDKLAQMGVEMLALLADPVAVGLGPLPEVVSRRAWVESAATAITANAATEVLNHFQYALRRQFPAYRGMLVDPDAREGLLGRLAGPRLKCELRAIVDTLIGELPRYPQEQLGESQFQRAARMAQREQVA